MNLTALNLIRSAVVQVGSSAIRAALLVAVTWLSAKGWLEASLATQILTVVPMVVISVAWSYFEKAVLLKLHLIEVDAALSLPADSTREQLAAALQATVRPNNAVCSIEGGSDVIDSRKDH